MNNLFNFKHRRDSGSVKLIFTPYELSKKPLRYWSNVGKIHKYSNFSKITKMIKNIVGDKWANNIHFISYYSGLRIIHPFHMHFMDDYFEFTIYDIFGDSKNRLFINRKIEKNYSYFTSEEINKINKYLMKHYDFVRKGYYENIQNNEKPIIK